MSLPLRLLKVSKCALTAAERPQCAKVSTPVERFAAKTRNCLACHVRLLRVLMQALKEDPCNPDSVDGEPAGEAGCLTMTRKTVEHLTISPQGTSATRYRYIALTLIPRHTPPSMRCPRLRALPCPSLRPLQVPPDPKHFHSVPL